MPVPRLDTRLYTADTRAYYARMRELLNAGVFVYAHSISNLYGDTARYVRPFTDIPAAVAYIVAIQELRPNDCFGLLALRITKSTYTAIWIPEHNKILKRCLAKNQYTEVYGTGEHCLISDIKSKPPY